MAQVLFQRLFLILGVMNDLWSFNSSTLQWTYWGGSQSAVVTDQYWNYDSKPQWPYHRHGGLVYTVDDIVYIIGGQIDLYTCKIKFCFCFLSVLKVGIDIWKLENMTWTWISGPPPNETVFGSPSVYKHFLEFSHENSLSPRGHASFWEYQGNLWLFGGYGSASTSLSSLNKFK